LDNLRLEDRVNEMSSILATAAPQIVAQYLGDRAIAALRLSAGKPPGCMIEPRFGWAESIDLLRRSSGLATPARHQPQIQLALLERDEERLNRLRDSHLGEFCFNMLAGKEASIHLILARFRC